MGGHMDTIQYKQYLSLLERELIPAMGCTEPIALAYCAASALEAAKPHTLQNLTKIDVIVSGNIIKNVKSVIVPNTEGQRGIETAVAAGLVSDNADKRLEVLTNLTDQQHSAMRELLNRKIIKVTPANNDAVLYVEILLTFEDGSARAVLEGTHTGLTRLERDGEVLQSTEAIKIAQAEKPNLSVKDIFDFAEMADPADLEPLVGRQIDCNMAIAEKGISENWGANVGRTLLEVHGDDVRSQARAYAAAGSDARMSGCEMPVVIVSGSGNQGITASVPVAIYARHLGLDRATLLRAVALSDLVTIHQKSGIGSLSAFCGAVCAGCGAGAGIAYLYTRNYDAVAHTIVNALAVISGMVCDGAKPSCAAKIAASLDAGVLGFELYRHGQQFMDGDGIVCKGVDNTIGNVSRMAKSGMRETDKVILNIMCGC